MLPSSPITTATHTAIDTLNPSLAAHVQVTLRVGHCAAAADLCHVTKVRVMDKGALKQSLYMSTSPTCRLSNGLHCGELWATRWLSPHHVRSTRAAVVMVGPAARPLAVGERSDLG